MNMPGGMPAFFEWGCTYGVMARTSFSATCSFRDFFYNTTRHDTTYKA
jgi:hypothetical protein